MIEIGTILTGVNLVKEIASYIGLLESLDVKIDRLSKSELDAGIRSLEQAKNSKQEKITLLREARNRFNKAISLEDNERLILSYLGLAMCHKHLGDEDNFIETLKAIDTVKFHGTSKYIAGSIIEYTLGFWKLALISNPLTSSYSISLELLKTRIARLEEIKETVKGFLNNKDEKLKPNA